MTPILQQLLQPQIVSMTFTAEEIEARYQRVLVSSLQGYCLYFKSVPPRQIEKTKEIHLKIISSSKFWKLAKHEVPLIKTAFFNVLTSIIEYASELLKDEKKKTITAIMNSLDETEPGLLSAVWESVLVAINKIEDWHTVVNMEKLVLPKLWRVLRNGGQCCATVVYPNLLPFLSQFPKLNVLKTSLYTNFFDNMREGFSAKSVLLSRSEIFAVTTSFTECLRYVIHLNSNDKELCEKLLQEQLITMIEFCAKENTPIKSILFSQITQLVRYWSKNRDNPESKLYSYLVQEFWQYLELMFNKLMDDANENFDTISTANIRNSQIDLLLTLKNAPVQSRKNLRVKFSDREKLVETLSQDSKSKAEDDMMFQKELNEFVNKICVTYYSKIDANSFRQNIGYLNKLMSNFESKDLFVALAKLYNADADLFDFYKDNLKDWLIEKPDEIETIIEFVFSLIRHMDSPGKNEVLTSLIELNNDKVLRHAVHCALSKKDNTDTIVKEWCARSNVTALLIDVAKQIASNDSSTDSDINKKILMLAFETSNDGDLLINEEVTNHICNILCDSLNENTQSDITNLAELVSQLLSLIWTHKKPETGSIRMLESIFELTTRHNFSDNSSISLENLRLTWKKGLIEISKKISLTRFTDLAKRFANVIWKKVFNSEENQFTDILVDAATDFVEVVVNNSCNYQLNDVKDVILTFLTESNIKECITDFTKIVLHGEIMSGNLYVSQLVQKVRIGQELVSIDFSTEVFSDNIENSLRWALFSGKLQNKLLSNISEDDCNDDENDELYNVEDRNLQEKYCMTQHAFPAIEEILTDIVYIVTLGHLYGNYYKSTENYNNINVLLSSLKEEIINLQAYVTTSPYLQETYNRAFSQFENPPMSHVGIYPHILQLCCSESWHSGNPAEYFSNYNSNAISIADNKDAVEACLQGIQILSAHLKFEDVPLSMEDDLNAMIIARSMLTKVEDDTQFLNILDRVIKRSQENPKFLQFNCNVYQVPWEELTTPLELIRLLTKLVKTIPTKLTFAHWDFILISVASWQLSVNKSQRYYNDFNAIALIIAVSELYCAVQNLMCKHEADPIEELPPTLLDEWKNVFADDLHVGITSAWMLYADLSNKKDLSFTFVIPLDYLGEAMRNIDSGIFSRKLNSTQVQSITSDQILKLSLKLLQSPVPNLQLSAYHASKHIIPEFVERDKVIIEADNFNPDTLNIKKFEGVLLSMQNIVNTMLMDFKLCETISCTIQPYTDSYTYTVGYLLAWAIVLDMCSNAHAELRYQYAEVLKNDPFTCLLNNLFRLMPVEVFQDNKNKATKLIEIFRTSPSLNFAESWTEERLDHIVCWLYANTLRHLPVLVRQWWSIADSRVGATVDKITTFYVSPMLCQEELFTNRLKNVENMQVRVHPAAREVVAVYQVEENKLELSMVLPKNHPLGAVTVEPSHHIGGSANLRNCHMQLSMFLTHQNGSIWDGLLLWKTNLDKRFSGAEECCICFSICHSSTYAIPKLSCRTCRKKFHTSCLYKWFNTSQKSTCPICRNVFYR
ncbi:uncharacterized protein LOC107265048 isoform X2 [Cephus cinctus]|uniref:E3 ubiquitin-protein ligase listerin n=1 Tax=Cephus cinctus TaxID=211228 RepID=A0AAJ7VZB5_CEPCN|nr:uncharacterized protein LOC107265048 isoform X2 [Cephus cinctus]